MQLKDKIKRIKSKRGGFRFTSRTIQSETRSIRCSWTREMVYDIESFHGIDAIQELEQILIRELNSQGPTN